MKLDFAPGVLEIDSCRATSQKKPVDKRKPSAKAKAACKRPASKKTYKKPSAKAQIHGGRFLVAVSRKRKEAAFFPLPNRATVAGAPGPPETAAEVLPVIGKKVISYKHIVGSDASKGLAAACKQLKVPAATARHSLSEFTPVQKIDKRKISAQALAALKKGVGKKSCKESKTSVTMVGGDQVAESHTANLKKQLSQEQQIVRLASGLHTHIYDLSALFNLFMKIWGLKW